MADLVAGSIQALVAESEADRLIRIHNAWMHYQGLNELPLTEGADGVDDNVRINLARKIVNKGVSWLFGADRTLKFAITTAEGAADEDAQKELDRLWPLAQRATQLHQLGVNGGISGHCFIRIMEVDPATNNDVPVRIVVWDPSNVTVKYSQDDIDLVLEYANTWTAIDEEGEPFAKRQRIVLDENGTSWSIVDEESRDEGESWVETLTTPWPNPWAPVFHCQNLPAPNEFWGAADLEQDILALIDAIVWVAGYARKLIRHRGHPLPYIIGEEAKKIAELNVALGRLLIVPNSEANIGQLQSADLGATLDFYNLLVAALCDTTSMPAHTFGMSIANVAEDTMELTFAPAVEKTWDKRITYGPMLASLTARILEVGAGREGLISTPQWTPVVPRSAKSEGEALERDLRMGIVSKETASGKRGYEWSVELDRISEETAAAAEAAAQAFNAGDITDGA